ncbi:MAG: bifunctional phosphopantothenoylcysteine decarboxylase/phosphopantothenate--cysteine ligase CoaBC [Deltaproteobacteria bacterium]|nr:bifunctional phosphopantothenoylcysteine decarboxylase/phosphopantothenate--cysteine ligase CoaBC [Deltaproteobacteria bacterium]
MVHNKTVVIGVSGGIAAYKIPELVRRLRKAGAEVRVVMTEHAQHFVTPLTFQTVSNNPVITEMFAPMMTADVAHISLADKADLVVVAPATANVIAKFAHGLAEDFLSTTVLATKAPVLLAPAMNVNMYTNSVTQENLQTLKARGFYVVGPDKGELACGWEGTGRMSEVEDILHDITMIMGPNDLKEEKILVTAGPTQEPIDPVRFVSNRSSGKMGYALAQAAATRGAEVTLITGPASLDPPQRIKTIPVFTATEMYQETLKRYKAMTTVIMAAAVSDYRPAQQAHNKIKKENDSFTLKLVRNPDILWEMGRDKGSCFIVGFAAETENLLKNARGKLTAKNVDLMVANDVTKPGAGFDSETNIVTLLTPDGAPEEIAKASKELIAQRILDKIMAIKANRRG